MRKMLTAVIGIVGTALAAHAGQSESLQWIIRGPVLPRESLETRDTIHVPQALHGTMTWTIYSSACTTPAQRLNPLGGCRVVGGGTQSNSITDAGRAHLREVLRDTATFAHFHGWGTSSTAVTNSDAGCLTELSAASLPRYTAGVRATGTQAAGSTAYIFESAGSNQITATGSVTLREFCLMSSATIGGGTIWSRIVTPDLEVSNGQFIDTTYRLTITP